MRRSMAVVVAAAAAMVTLSLEAQTSGEKKDPGDLVTIDKLMEQAKPLIADAQKNAAGSSGITLEKYKGHYTMLTTRTKSGGGELHRNFSDFLIVIDGEGAEITGGTVVDPKESQPGEVRGTRVEGGVTHPLHKGDVIHVPAGTAHQAVMKPGQTLTLYVIKVEEPKQ